MNEWLEYWYRTFDGDTWVKMTAHFESLLRSRSTGAARMAAAQLETLNEQLAYTINDHYHEWNNSEAG